MTIETIKSELKSHVVEFANHGIINESNFEDAHFYTFNEGYYIVGYNQAREWLKKHEIDPFDAIRIITEYENDNFGEVITKEFTPEDTVNMIVHIYGHEIIPYADTWEEFKEKLEL